MLIEDGASRKNCLNDKQRDANGAKNRDFVQLSLYQVDTVRVVFNNYVLRKRWQISNNIINHRFQYRWYNFLLKGFVASLTRNDILSDQILTLIKWWSEAFSVHTHLSLLPLLGITDLPEAIMPLHISHDIIHLLFVFVLEMPCAEESNGHASQRNQIDGYAHPYENLDRPPVHSLFTICVSAILGGHEHFVTACHFEFAIPTQRNSYFSNSILEKRMS